MNNYISTLEELYNHPDNGKDDVFLAAFLSTCGTFPIFITKVEEFSGTRFKADCIGYKWGYPPQSGDVMRFTAYDDNLTREVSRQFFTWVEVHEHRFAPGGRAPMPLAMQAKCHFLPLSTYLVDYRVKTTDDQLGWYGSCLATNVVSEKHALHMVTQHHPDATYMHASLVAETGVWAL